MANLFDYIKWRGDLDFSKAPLNPVDFLIFSQISYLPFDGIVPAPGEKDGISLHLALEILLEKLHTSDPADKHKEAPVLYFKEDPDFINALITSKRFGNCYLLGFVNQIDIDKETQFSALCIYTDRNSFITAFRGTDATIVGWKEDFNMSFREVVPAQLESVKYLNKMASLVNGDIQLCGHSKGGNLAVYASSFCDEKIQKRIKDIYCFDSPGFHETIINSDNYSRIKSKIHSYIPQTSIVGMMLEHGCDYTVVKSSEKGFTQHILFTWEVMYNDMIKVDKVDLSSRFVDKTIRDWISTLNNKQREQFIDSVYKILCSSEVKTVHEMESSWLLSLGRIIKSMGTIDDETRKLVLKTFSRLFYSAKNNLNTLFKR